MSRIKMLQHSHSGSQHPTRNFMGRIPLIDQPPQVNFPHRVFVPRSYEPGYAYPLVVWLHSDDSSEMELDGVMQALSTQNYIAVAPRSHLRSKSSSRRFRWGTSLTDCAVAEDMVWECVHELSDKLSVHPDRVFLAGFGGGATLAQWIALRYPSRFAGVVSLSGVFPRTPRPLVNWKQAKALQVLFAQRSGSALCNDDEFVRAMKTSHQASLSYKFWRLDSKDDVEGEGDELDSTMLQAANRFMMSIVTDTPLSLGPEITPDQNMAEFGMN